MTDNFIPADADSERFDENLVAEESFANDSDPSPSQRPRSFAPPSQGGAGGEAPQRLAKILAAAGIAARRKCEEFVTAGRVTVDGEVVTDLAFRADPNSQDIKLDGERIKLQRKVYFVLNKPRGVVCTNYDPAGRPRVMDLFPQFRERLFTIGRLDEESEGLLLVTNDGELANRMAHPRYRVPKFYLCHVKGVPSTETLATLKRGMFFEEGRFQVEGVRMKKVVGDSAYLDIVLNEGQNREIRRLMARVDHKVMRLKRVGFGPIRLGDLPSGAYRPLNTAEVRLLLDLSQQRAHLDSTAGRGRRKPASRGQESGDGRQRSEGRGQSSDGKGQRFGERKSFGKKPPFGAKRPFARRGSPDPAENSTAGLPRFGERKSFGKKPPFGAKRPFVRRGSPDLAENSTAGLPIRRSKFGRPAVGPTAGSRDPRRTSYGHGEQRPRGQRRPPRRFQSAESTSSFDQESLVPDSDFGGRRRRFVTKDTAESTFQRRPARGPRRPARGRNVADEAVGDEAGQPTQQRRPSRGPRRYGPAGQRELPPRGKGQRPARPPRPMTADGKEILQGKITGYRTAPKEGLGRRRRVAIQGMQANRKQRQQRRKKSD